MQTTLPHEPEAVDPLETKIIVRCIPSSVRDSALAELREVGKPRGRESDCLRSWLRGVADAEIARRNSDGGALEEPAAWKIPWHSWNDLQLASALAASYSWFEVATDESTTNVLREIHRALVTAACTRLGELHDAIQRGQVRKGN